jgi:hypothetical protein
VLSHKVSATLLGLMYHVLTYCTLGGCLLYFPQTYFTFGYNITHTAFSKPNLHRHKSTKTASVQMQSQIFVS